MPENKPIHLLIDGNNLAHFLYQDLLPGQKMTEEISQRLMIHLDSYSRQNSGLISLELYLDRFPQGSSEYFSSLRIFPAEYPQSADDILIDRFWFHHIVLQPCLVVTNDEDILEEVKYAGGNSLRVFDFVRRRGLINPVFRDPIEFPVLRLPPKEEKPKPDYHSLRTSIYFRIGKERAERSAKEPVLRKQIISNCDSTESPPEPQNLTIGGLFSHPTPEIQHQDIQTVSSLETPLPASITAPPSIPSNSGQMLYRADIDSWPPGEGVRFLKHAFCSAHRKEYQDLLGAIDYNAIKPADLRAVAELLLYACGAEVDLARRGSTMDRVRMAILLNGGKELTITEIAAITGLKQIGLHRKIKEKAGRWISLVQPGEIVTE
jgi:hypothetical protein